MDESTKSSPCKECENGAESVLVHQEVDHLRQHLAERDGHILALEGEFLKCSSRVNDLEEQVGTWREKYERLYDSHKRVQKLNQVLEDKLLQMVDKMKGEKSQLTKDIATLSVRLAESKHNYSMLQKENERYKNDMNLAIQLLQCKPDNFVAQKLDNLPVDTQARVSQYVMTKTSKPSSLAQSKNGNEVDTFDASEYEFNISASLMSKILEDSIQDTLTKHCDSCTCNKSQNKPFCYNESYYSVSTQTLVSGEMKNSLCLHCNSEIKSAHSYAGNLSIRSVSPHGVKLINEKTANHGLMAPLYLIPQPNDESHKDRLVDVSDKLISVCSIVEDEVKTENKCVSDAQTESASKVDAPKVRTDNVDMEPSVHHKLCGRTKTSISSKKSSVPSIGNDELLMNKDPPLTREVKKFDKADDVSIRKNSHSSMGAVSRTSSIAKSTVSTHKSNTQVGPGPRFCHLRMQAGSKNILLDNAEPDVPPVLYRRQSKCNENSILFKDLTDGVDNFIELNKTKSDVKNDNVVVESTLVDVHVDNNTKEIGTTSKNAPINPILMNVSSSPLQPLKSHNFSNSSEQNNNKSTSIDSHNNTAEINNLLNDFTIDMSNAQNNNKSSDSSKKPVTTPTDNHDVKIFNFDRYEQKLTDQFINKSLKKIDMSQIHSLENTRIFKDLPPLEAPKADKKVDATKPSLPPIVNVYPNLTQTHLKVNVNNKVFTNEQSTSSLSSDDSAALLQKQQLLRVAEWVEKNLEQQNNFNDPLEDDVNFNKAMLRDSRLSRLTETLNELALNMPHPVSKYSKSYSRDANSAWVHSMLSNNHTEKVTVSNAKMTASVAKETIFPVESGDATVTEVTNDIGKTGDIDIGKELREAVKMKGGKEITPEDLARMEYNVKKFLLSGPQWASIAGRSRCTSSKTETDV